MCITTENSFKKLGSMPFFWVIIIGNTHKKNRTKVSRSVFSADNN